MTILPRFPTKWDSLPLFQPCLRADHMIIYARVIPYMDVEMKRFGFRFSEAELPVSKEFYINYRQCVTKPVKKQVIIGILLLHVKDWME